MSGQEEWGGGEYIVLPPSELAHVWSGEHCDDHHDTTVCGMHGESQPAPDNAKTCMRCVLGTKGPANVVGKLCKLREGVMEGVSA
ncbi:MAG: hypothetical protein Q8R28_04330 [Dehalococcoidia bacterium]|nr:hypothetical protein [Dehalococcoidia bacterium]